MITKGDISRGAYQFLRIWGITTNASNEDEILAINTLDDYALQLESGGLLTGYQAPSEYGLSDPNDDSGLADWMAGPFKKLLAIELMSAFGKPLTQELMKISDEGMRTLQHALVVVPCAQNPGTLPKGSGNEWAYRDNKFYNEPAQKMTTETDGAIDDITIDNSDNTFHSSTQ